MSEEKSLYSENPKMFQNNPLGFIIALVLCLAGIGLVILLVWWLRCKATTFTVTSKRTTLRTGILTKATSEVLHRDVRNVQISQGIIQRMFGIGNIGISSAGTGGTEIAAWGLPTPDKVKSIIDQYRG